MIKKVFTLTLTAIILSPGLASAVEIPGLEKVKAVVKKTNACEVLSSKVDERSARFEGAYTVQDSRFLRLVEALKRIESDLKSKGVNTESLNSQIMSFESMRNTIMQDKTAFMAAMTSAKESSCVSKDEFKKNLGLARDAQKKMVGDIKDIQNYAGTLRETIVRLRDQSKNTTATSTATSTAKVKVTP